jgi:hypothetical protein
MSTYYGWEVKNSKVTKVADTYYQLRYKNKGSWEKLPEKWSSEEEAFIAAKARRDNVIYEIIQITVVQETTTYINPGKQVWPTPIIKTETEGNEIFLYIDPKLKKENQSTIRDEIIRLYNAHSKNNNITIHVIEQEPIWKVESKSDNEDQNN